MTGQMSGYMSDGNPIPSLALKCPVCGAGFRGTESCSRCGTDLVPLMKVAARAWALRQKSRQLLRSGDLDQAVRTAATAWDQQHAGIEPPGGPGHRVVLPRA
jgi:predicted amidophosphoribosyltransferase